MRAKRWGDNDRYFGPFTYARDSRGLLAFTAVLDSGHDEYPGCSLRCSAFGHTIIAVLPPILRPYRIKHMATSWDAATIERLGRDWYYKEHSREYGFDVSGGFLRVFLGAQTHNSTTTQSWSKFLPWTQWRHVRFSLYNPDGSHFWTQYDRGRIAGFDAYTKQFEMEKSCPSVAFLFDDYDGTRITATCQIHEREWHFGDGWFRWLHWFRRAKVIRSLDLKFSAEVGPEKGSWKGGTVGHGIDMLSGESCEAAFRRYCAQEHRQKGRTFGLRFVEALA